MNATSISLLAGTGLVAGVMNSIAGGGTIVTFPALIFAGVPPILANATSTVALLPGTTAGVVGYRRNLPAVREWIAMFFLVSVVGGLIGGILLTRTPERVFNRLVPFLILGATLIFLARSFFSRAAKQEAELAREHKSKAWIAGAIAFQFIVSVYGGYFGAGIGILMLATLGALGLNHIHQMNVVKGVLGLAVNVTAALYFVYAGLVEWLPAGIIALGGIAGGYAGAHFAQRISQRLVRQLIGLVGFALSAAMFWQQLRR